MQDEKPRRLSERTVDFGLAAMEFCEALPRTAAGRHEAACCCARRRASRPTTPRRPRRRARRTSSTR